MPTLEPSPTKPRRTAPLKAMPIAEPNAQPAEARFRPQWYPRFFIAGSLALYLIYVIRTVRGSSELYLPADGANYLAEARYVAGQHVVDFIHPIMFPALVVLWRRLVGFPQAFEWAMFTTLFVVWICLFVLTRRWASWPAAAIGTSAGMLLPVVAEIIGWGGGANLFGLAPLCLTIAANELWIRRRSWEGGGVGALLGITFLTHPFVGTVAALVIGTRIASEVLSQRRLDRGRGPTGLLGWLAFGVGFAIIALIALPYYSGLQETGAGGLGLPSINAVLTQFRASARESSLILALELGALTLPLFKVERGLRVVAAAMVTIVIGFPLLVRADPTYLSRVLYLLPILVGLAVASLWDAVWSYPSRPRWLAWKAPRRVGFAVLALVLLATVGFGQRARSSMQFYGVVDRQDVRALESLSHAPGSVATSWFGNRYAEPMNWFISGVAGRKSIGPIAPWLSTRRDETRKGADAQRLLAGERTIENGQTLFGIGPSGSITSGALLIRVRDYYTPSAFIGVDPGGGDVEDTSGAGPQQDNGQMTWSIRRSGSQVGTATARFERGTLVITYAREPTSSKDGWTLTLRPTAGVAWRHVAVEANGNAEIAQRVLDRQTSILMRSPSSTDSYVPYDTAFSGPVLHVSSPNSTLELRISLSGGDHPQRRTETSSAAELLRRYHITNFVIWRNTQLQGRFADNRCYALTTTTPDLLIYNVQPACRR